MEDCDEEYEDSLSEIPFFEGNKQLRERYVYEEEIGTGAYGRVMCGYRRKDHCSVAIKVIPCYLVNDWYHCKMLDRKIPLEILLLALTRKIEGVVSIIEYYEDLEQKEWSIVMERNTKAVDLFEYMTEIRYVQEDLACNILYQLLIIIKDCHLHGVVHRDIKEENILIDVNTKNIFLIDFGSGCLMRDDRHTTYNGTVAYSPPEWLRYNHYRGCQLESWTLGIVLYSLVCGNVPFEDEEEILSGIVRFPRKLTKPCQDLILRCLESNPEHRIQPIEMMTHPWVTNNLMSCDSGRGSFDSVIIDAPVSRKCSCSCAETIICLGKDHDNDHVSAIEKVSYDQDCIKQIDPDWQFKVIPKTSSPDIDRKHYILLARSLEEIWKPSLGIFSGPDKGYNEDIDDDFQVEEDSLVNSNENFF